MKTLVIPAVFFATTLVRSGPVQVLCKTCQLTLKLRQVVDYVVFDLQGNAICNVGDVAVAFVPAFWVPATLGEELDEGLLNWESAAGTQVDPRSSASAPVPLVLLEVLGRLLRWDRPKSHDWGRRYGFRM